MGDLRNVLTGLNGASSNSKYSSVPGYSPNEALVTESPNNFKCGEHVACIWHDEEQNQLNWFLGVVDIDVGDADDVNVSYMKRTDKQGLRWLFPEEAEILKTSIKMVLMPNVTISYTLTAMCQVNRETCISNQESFDNFDFSTILDA